MDGSQFHHYIPRFILRNFAHQTVVKPPKIDGPVKRRKRKSKATVRDGVLSIVDLCDGPPWLVSRPLAKTFGEQDLYRDLNRATNQHHLEEQLSKLESRAGDAISKIKTAYETGHGLVSLAHTENDALRKFLFIMKYRGPSQYQRYAHDSINSYTANDKVYLQKYMQEKRFQRPIDVWFHNIQAILDAEIDANTESNVDAIPDMYPLDALWFKIHMGFMYLAICTPCNKDDEFLLSGNVFSVHEGPTDFRFDFKTGTEISGTYTEYHILNVIHPKIVLVLRSVMLPCIEEDLDPKLKSEREILYNLCRNQHHDPDKAHSMLFDLPVKKATNSCSVQTANDVVPTQGHNRRFRPTDTFNFNFFPISPTQVEKMNAIILDNINEGSLIAYKSQDALQRTVEAYLTMDNLNHGAYGDGFKSVIQGTTRHRYIKNLVLLSKQLGSTKKAVYIVHPSTYEDQKFFDAWGETFENHISDSPTEFMLYYTKLGGTLRQLPRDLDQSQRIVRWRIKLDVYTKGLPEDQRDRIREMLAEMIMKLPVVRVWLYVKRLRGLELQHSKSVEREKLDHFQDGPEDNVVRLKNLFRAQTFCRTMYFTARLHTWCLLNPGVQPPFRTTGKILDCGISAIEELAKAYMTSGEMWTIAQQLPDRASAGVNMGELVLRWLIRRNFGNILGPLKLEPKDLIDLEHVFFNLLYTFPPT